MGHDPKSRSRRFSKVPEPYTSPPSRFKERERVMEMFEKDLHLPVTCVDASEQFLSELKGVTDPERKRKIIGAGFITVFDAFATQLESKLGRRPKFLVQGTLYPDVIESCPPPGSGKKHSHMIKSHHNVGGLPKNMRLGLVEPLKWLFKDEVRGGMSRRASLWMVFRCCGRRGGSTGRVH